MRGEEGQVHLRSLARTGREIFLRRRVSTPSREVRSSQSRRRRRRRRRRRSVFFSSGRSVPSVVNIGRCSSMTSRRKCLPKISRSILLSPKLKCRSAIDCSTLCSIRRSFSSVPQVSSLHLLHSPFFISLCEEYCSRMAQPSLESSPYLQTLGTGLQQGISIFWTGPKVVSRRVTSSHLADVQRVLKRRVTIWENLNANDYDQRRLCLGPLTGRSSDLIGQLNGLLINPNCEFEVNFIPLNTLAQWFHSSPATPYRVEEALEKALRDWLDELPGLTLDDLRLLVDFFYLPYQNGRQAQTLLNEFYWLRWTCEEKIDEEWKRRSSIYREKVKEIQHFYERMIAMNNRAVLYDLYGYIQDLNSCISLSRQFLQWLEERPSSSSSSSSSFMSGDVEPWNIRGALAGDFLVRLFSFRSF